MRHFLYFTFIAASICFHSSADIKRFIETWKLSDLTFNEMSSINKFKLPKTPVVITKEMKVCEQLCCANIILTIRKGQLNLARRKLKNFLLLIETTQQDYQLIYDWDWLNEILSDIDQISEILKQKRSEEEDVNISRMRIYQTQDERITTLPIKHSREFGKDFISEETSVLPQVFLPTLTTKEPTQKHSRLSSNSQEASYPAQRINLELPVDAQDVLFPPRIWLPNPGFIERKRERPDILHISVDADGEDCPCIKLPIPINFQKPAILDRENNEDSKL